MNPAVNRQRPQRSYQRTTTEITSAESGSQRNLN
jgi:hypothetical protein